MSEPKFTPGEWDINTHLSYVVVNKENRKYIAICDDPKLSMNQRIPREQVEANARLIAAAPTMYALLKEVYPFIDEWNYPIDLGDRMKELFEKVEWK